MQNDINDHSKSFKNYRTKPRNVLNYNESRPTQKQLQLEEFNLNLKLNRISKHGKKNNEKIKVPVLNKVLRNRLQNSQIVSYETKGSRISDSFNPLTNESLFEKFKAKSYLNNKSSIS